MAEMEALCRKWFARLVRDEAWRLQVVPDQFRTGAEVKVDGRLRTATIYYQIGLAPAEEVACHEICHILLNPLFCAVNRVTDCLDGNAHDVAVEWLDQANEEVCNSLARRFVQAYGEAEAVGPGKGGDDA